MWCDMIYDIYLLQLGFYPVAAVGSLVQKQERDSYTVIPRLTIDPANEFFS